MYHRSGDLAWTEGQGQVYTRQGLLDQQQTAGKMELVGKDSRTTLVNPISSQVMGTNEEFVEGEYRQVWPGLVCPLAGRL